MYVSTQDNKSMYRNHSKLLISESPLQVLPTLAVKIGLNEALMLQQVHYWISNPMNRNVRNERVWVYKSYSEWRREFPFWSMRTIQRTMLSLEEKKILVVDSFNRLITDRTKWYSIDYEILDSFDIGTYGQNGTMVVPTWHNGSAKLERSIPETTTEITIENNNKNTNKVIKLSKEEFISHVEPKAIVKPEPQPEPEPIEKPRVEPIGSVVVNLMKMIKSWAISKVLLETWIKKHGVGYVLQKIELTKSANPRKPGAYLNKAIELDWLPPAPKEDEEGLNKPLELTFPTYEENVAWYNKLDEKGKLAILSEAIHKQGYFEGHLKNANISVLDVDFTSNSFFKMLMQLVGRAR